MITDMLNKNVLVTLYGEDENYTHYIWDVIVAAIIYEYCTKF